MDFTTAANTVIPFGKHCGKQIDVIAEDSEGLRYLDWLHGEMEGTPQQGSRKLIAEALSVYFSDQVIQQELDELGDFGVR